MSKEMEDNLRNDFAENFNKKKSRYAIMILYKENENIRIEIDVPYSLSNGILEIGPYFKNIHSSIPEDYEKRKKRIPVIDIVKYKKLDIGIEFNIIHVIFEFHFNSLIIISLYSFNFFSFIMSEKNALRWRASSIYFFPPNTISLYKISNSIGGILNSKFPIFIF